MSLIRRMQPVTVTRHLSVQVLDRIIDVAIMVFLICSVVPLPGRKPPSCGAGRLACKLVRAPNNQALHLPLLLPMAAFYPASVRPRRRRSMAQLKDLRNVFEPVFFRAGNHQR
jgi:hypothetical protein